VREDEQRAICIQRERESYETFIHLEMKVFQHNINICDNGTVMYVEDRGSNKEGGGAGGAGGGAGAAGVNYSSTATIL